MTIRANQLQIHTTPPKNLKNTTLDKRLTAIYTAGVHLYKVLEQTKNILFLKIQKSGETMKINRIMTCACPGCVFWAS